MQCSGGGTDDHHCLCRDWRWNASRRALCHPFMAPSPPHASLFARSPCFGRASRIVVCCRWAICEGFSRGLRERHSSRDIQTARDRSPPVRVSGVRFYCSGQISTGVSRRFRGSSNGLRLARTSTSRRPQTRVNNGDEFSKGGNDLRNNGVAEFFRKAQVIVRVCDVLREVSWTDDTISALNALDLEFDTFIVSQVLKSGIPADTAFGFFNWLKDLEGFSHSHHTYHAIIGCLAEARRIDDMQAVVEEFRKSCSVSGEVSVSFSDLLSWYGKAKSLDWGLKVWNQMKRFGATLTTESYNILIDLYAHHRLYDESVDFLSEMAQQGVLPNARTYTILIKHLAKANKLETAFEIFRRLPEMKLRPTMRQFSILVIGFSNVGNAVMVRLLLDQLREEGRRPEREVHYAVRALKKQGKLTEAESIARDFFLDSCTKEETVEVLDMSDEDTLDMEGTDDEADQVCAKHAWKTFALWFNPNALASVLRTWTPSTELSLTEANVAWNAMLVDGVLRGFKKAEMAWKFYCWVERQPGYRHDNYSIYRMILILARQGYAEAVDLFVQARCEGRQFSMCAINNIIRAYGIAKNWKEAVRMFRKIELLNLKPNEATYLAMIRILVNTQNVIKALKFLWEMEEAGFKPGVETYTIFVKHFGQARDAQMAHLMFERILESGNKPNAKAYTALIDAYCQAGNSDAALKLYEDMAGTGLKLTAATRSLLIRSLHRDNNLRAAIGLERDAVSSISPDCTQKAISGDFVWVYDLYSKNLAGNLKSG
eukprot:c26283_g1_i1 orf=103-2409(+)